MVQARLEWEMLMAYGQVHTISLGATVHLVCFDLKCVVCTQCWCSQCKRKKHVHPFDSEFLTCPRLQNRSSWVSNRKSITNPWFFSSQKHRALRKETRHCLQKIRKKAAGPQDKKKACSGSINKMTWLKGF